MNRIHANGLEFAYLEQGEGPLVLLLHGFPDTAYSWSHQVPALAEAGYRTVAPYLRGYPPSEIPRDGFYDKGTLVADIAALIRALSGDAQAISSGRTGARPSPITCWRPTRSSSVAPLSWRFRIRPRPPRAC